MLDGCAAGASLSSYLASDVTLLVREVTMPVIGTAEKERLIQTGAAHYSEMISDELRPDADYLGVYHDAFARHLTRMGAEMRDIADHLITRSQSRRGGQPGAKIVLISLMRAGLPYGVVLQRLLAARADHSGVCSSHFGASIIRDKGLDEVAIRHILSEHDADDVVFVDGWTGKGAIRGELDRSWRALTGKAPYLVVLADPARVADFAGSHEDWLIPSGLLGSSVTGLVSRTIRTAGQASHFDGVMRVESLADIDTSLDYVDRITRAAMTSTAFSQPACGNKWVTGSGSAAQVIADICDEFGIRNRNRIKPGIAEATRVLLRRLPERVLVANPDDPDLAGLRLLAGRHNILLTDSPLDLGPYRAVSLIAKAD